METHPLTKTISLCAALLAATPAVAHAVPWALAAGAGKQANGDKIYFLAVADPRVPDHATGIVSLLAPGGTLRLEGRVECLLVTGNRALLKGPILRPPSQAGQTFILGAVDRDVQGHSQVPDETGLRVVAPDFSCPGTVVAATEPLVQGDVVLWSPVPANNPPVAAAGPDQAVRVGTTVTLDGSASSDPDGNPLTFRWSLVGKPAGSTAALSDPTAVMPTFVVDRPGNYVAQLIVNDGTVNSAPDTVTISTVNSAPVANAGPDQETFVGRTVTLDGSASSDVDGDPLTFAWSLTSRPAGSTATFADPTAARPTFVADRPGSYVARLVVNDGTVNSAPDTVTISTLNSPPVARAGPDQTAFVGHIVTLDGSASSDVDGDPLTFSWFLISSPAGSTATLSDPAAVMPTFVVDRPGNYVAQLVVNDGTVNSAPDTVTISTVDSAPVANAGPDQTAFVGHTVTLDGSASSDADGDPLTFGWSFVSRPAGSTATLSDATAVMPSFRVDRAGSYVLQLVVNDGILNSAPDTVTISTLNSAPVANAGPDQTAFVGNTVTLDGSGSSDVDGDPLTYAWSLISTPTGSSAALSDPAAVTPTFVVDLPGSYVVQLIVNDGTASSAPDTVTISTLNSAPVANAGPDQTAFVGHTVTLDGSGSSDVDGDPLTFSWSLLSRPAGSTTTLSDPTAVTPTFVVDRPGAYVAQLIVNDGSVNSAPDTVTISTLNSAPVANAGPDQTAFVGDTVTLDGSGSSDVDGDSLTFAWSIVSRPVGSDATLSDATAVTPTFVVDSPGTYVAQLIVNDGTASSAPDTVTISTLNSAPVANAGPDQTAFVGDTVSLDGSASSDVDGDPLTFSWSLLSRPTGSAAMLSDPTAVTPSFGVDLPGTYVAQLIVNDGTASSAPDTVTISTLNSAPVANAGPDQTAFVGNTVTLDGSASSDVDGDPLTFAWSITSRPTGSTATLSNPTAVMPSFEVDRPGTYVAQLIVNDGTMSSAPDTVSIFTLNSAPVANAGPDQSVFVGDSVTLDGSASSDVDGDPLTFAWALISRPAGSAAALSDPTAVMPTFVADRAGSYELRLIVNDGTVDSAPDTVTIAAVTPLTLSLAPDPLTVTQGLGAAMTLSLSVPAPAGGLTINLSTDNPAIATVPPTVTVPQDQTSAEITVTGVGVGSTTMRASTPGSAEATATVNVVPGPLLSILDQTIGKDLQVSTLASLGAPAPPEGVQLTISSADTTHVVLSTSATGVGSASIVLTVAGGSTSSPSFFVQAVAGSGSALITASAPGFTADSATIALNPSGFVIISPGNFTTTSLSANRSIEIRPARLNPGGALTFAEAQALRGGLPPVNVPVTSSNTTVGVITVSPLVFNPGASVENTAFDPQNGGTTTITVEPPAGFSTPANLRQITATVTAPNINLGNLTIGKDLQVSPPASLGAAPPEGVDVTITSADPTHVLLSASETALGTASIVQTVPPGTTAVPAFFVQALAEGGIVQLTASAPAFNTRTVTVTLNPSGFIILSPGVITTTPPAPNTTIVIRSARLNPGGALTFAETQALRGGLLPVNVPVTSSNTTVGVITVSPLVFNAGASVENTAFDPQSAGTTTITVEVPPGFSTPANRRQITATVNP